MFKTDGGTSIQKQKRAKLERDILQKLGELHIPCAPDFYVNKLVFCPDLSRTE